VEGVQFGGIPAAIELVGGLGLAVAEQLCDVAQIGAAGQGGPRPAVAEGVRVVAAGDGRGAGQAIEQGVNAAGVSGVFFFAHDSARAGPPGRTLR